MPKKLLSTKIVAKILGVTTRQVTALCVTQRLVGALKEGKSWKIPEEAVAALQEERAEAIPEEQRLLPVPVGITNYKEIANKSYYVDKTLIIKQILDEMNQVILFTRPRRFGKTMLLDMLKTYFEKTNEDTSQYFTQRLIWQAGAQYTKEQGQYPVVNLSFKDAKWSNWQSVRFSIADVIASAYSKFRDLGVFKALSASDKKFIEKVLQQNITDDGLAISLRKLTAFLYKFYGKQCIVMLDEYDTPIQSGYFHGFYDEVIEFMRNMFSAAFKDNHYLKYGFLTGILRVSKENLFSGLNNIVVDTVLDNKYCQYFGFTAAEVQALAKYYGQEAKLPILKAWYDGYNFGTTEIYNPWSIVNYFANACVAKPYWLNTSDNVIIKQLLNNVTPDIAKDLKALINGGNVLTKMDINVIYPQLDESPDLIYSFLMMAGYLKPVEIVGETDDGTYYMLTIPNKEIKQVYAKEIVNWISHNVGISVVMNLQRALFMQDAVAFEELIGDFLQKSVSYFDTSKESFYHGLLLGMTGIMSTQYFVRSNREAGKGRFDIVLEPKEKTRPAYLFEFKVAKSTTELAAKAQEALAQIAAKAYYTELKERGYTPICYGLAFFGKEVSLAQAR